MRRMMALALLFMALPGRAASTVLERVEVLPATVRLHLSTPVNPQAHPLTAPDRVFVDLPETTLGPAVPRVLAGAGLLVRVRTGQFTSTTARVVLDLARQVPCTVRVDGALVTISLPGATTAARPTPPPPASPAASKTRAVVRPGAGRRPKLFLELEELEPLLAPRRSSSPPPWGERPPGGKGGETPAS